jgi:hypothetical protein
VRIDGVVQRNALLGEMAENGWRFISCARGEDWVSRDMFDLGILECG